MAARADSVCRHICEKGGWTVTNLQLQKLLYVAQMVYLGIHGDRLADISFEAWDYGPVAPSVHRKVRMFGASPIQDVFLSARPFAPDSPRLHVLDDICRDLLDMTPGKLVEITHWEKGAWAKHYVAGARGTRIPDASILAEYKNRCAEGHIDPSGVRPA